VTPVPAHRHRRAVRGRAHRLRAATAGRDGPAGDRIGLMNAELSGLGSPRGLTGF